MRRPEQSRRNIRQGLFIGGLVVASVGMFMFMFSQRGLPKDPKFFPTIEQRANAGADDGETSSSSGVTPPPSTLSVPSLELASPSADSGTQETPHE